MREREQQQQQQKTATHSKICIQYINGAPFHMPCT